MKEYIKAKVSHIVEAKLTSDQIEELIGFFRQALSNNLNYEDESFFRNIAYEMTGGIKDLALLVIDFRKDLRSRICPKITDLAIKHIPQAADQLEGIIETTEMAANKIMDNLESMQGHTEAIEQMFDDLKKGEIRLPGNKKRPVDSQTIESLRPLINDMESRIQNYMHLLSDTFVQMSFQDLTGQRIRRIMDLVGKMERKLKEMILSFGFKLNEYEKNPERSKDDLQKAFDEKVSDLAGPQRNGQGLDQTDIDQLLMNL
ncbi:MAG: protein phosphatase CheZ [Proteobacteria bacterium]|nr:protein phosphatase CheZ [Pseudomonadota bacterium]